MRTFPSFFFHSFLIITIFFRKFSQIFLGLCSGTGLGSPLIFFAKYSKVSFLIEGKFFHFEMRLIFIFWIWIFRAFIEGGNHFEYLINWDIRKPYFFIISCFKFKFEFEARIRGGFFFDFCRFATLGSRTNRRIPTKKKKTRFIGAIPWNRTHAW